MQHVNKVASHFPHKSMKNIAEAYSNSVKCVGSQLSRIMVQRIPQVIRGGKKGVIEVLEEIRITYDCFCSRDKVVEGAIVMFTGCHICASPCRSFCMCGSPGVCWGNSDGFMLLWGKN